MKLPSVAISLIYLISPLIATNVTLPQPTGPYPVGTTALQFDDLSRKERHAWWGHRKFMVQIYFPLDLSKNNALFDYMPLTLTQGKVGSLTVKCFSAPSVPISSKGPFPLILMHLGTGQCRQAYTILCEDLASYGFIVLCFDHPYISSYVRFHDGSAIVPNIIESFRVIKSRPFRYTWFEQGVQTSLKDINFFFSKLDEINQNYFNNQIDQQRIGIQGHSFGGNVALRAGFSCKKISAIVDIDSKITELIKLPDNSHAKPTLFIRSEQYQEDVGSHLRDIKNSRVRPFEVKHSAFLDVAFLAPHMKIEIPGESFWGLFWHTLFKRGPIFNHIDTSLGKYTQKEWWNTFRKTVREFWNEHLKSKGSDVSINHPSLE